MTGGEPDLRPDPTTDTAGGASPAPHRTGTGRTASLVALVVLVATGVAAVIAVMTFRGDDPPGISRASETETFEYDYLIPRGTQGRLDRGETVEIVPPELTVKVGESIRIVNDDDADHIVGTFFVPAGSTLRQHFNSPGELSGECDVHPSGRFRLVVEP